MTELECTCGADEANWMFHDADCPRRHLDGPWIPDPFEEGDEDMQWLLDED